MISLQNLSKSFGARCLFTIAGVDLRPGARYGLVGANGSGKSTLLRIVSGEEPPSDGHVTLPKQLRLGILKQDQFLADDARVIDVAMQGDQAVYDAMLEQSRQQHCGPLSPRRVAELDEFVRAHDGWTLEARSCEILAGLGIPVTVQQRPLSTLSGGFKLRVLLARVLISRPDLLLLDEPTNHLDILSIRWLEKFLVQYPGCAVIVSHDRRFLDQIATHILDIDYGTVTVYAGNYGQFEVQKCAVRERKESEIARQEKLLGDKLAFVERFRYKATKARQAQSRVKQIEKIEIVELPRSTRRMPHFHFDAQRPSGVDVLSLAAISKSFGEHRVLSNVSFSIRRGERIAMIGPNGIGKSTLLKIAVGCLEPDSGSFRWGYETHRGYFSQDHRDQLGDGRLSLLEWLWSFCSTQTEGWVRSQLGKVLFTGDDVHAKLQTLSGGESARALFCRLMVEQPNVLILDEPTNHLDLEATESLVLALKQFDGTVLFVSHDRWFVSLLATRVIELVPEGYRDSPGTFEEYLVACGDDHLDSEAVVLRAKSESKTRSDGDVTSRATSQKLRNELKRKRNRLKNLPLRRDAALTRVAVLEAEIKAIESNYALPEFFVNTPAVQLQELHDKQLQLQDQLAQAMSDWETLESELVTLETELQATNTGEDL
jgi:ATPase subunit of ABC transporter with duplicated ATPase domains